MQKSVWLVALIILSAPLMTTAQVPSETPTQPEMGAAFLQSFQERDACFSAYEYGGVHFELNPTDNLGKFAPQATVTVKGKVVNDKGYLLPQGRIVANVLKRNDKFAPKNWHSYIADIEVPGDYSLNAKGSRDFSLNWKIPALAPAGTYQIDLYYLVGKRYVMSGIPYVVNMPGKSVSFDVLEAGNSVAATFDRNSVQLSGNPLELRAVPPTLPADKSVSASVFLVNDSKDTAAIKITKALYEWSDTDSKPPIVQTTETKTVAGGASVPVTFDWSKPVAGVHELVLSAQPIAGDALPSIIKIRFGIEGNAPRIIFSGFTATGKDMATVTTCTVNGTFTNNHPGSVVTSVIINGKAVSQIEKKVTDTSMLFTSKIQVPLSELARGAITVKAEAKDETGKVTDSNTMTYPARPNYGAAVSNKSVWIFIVCIVIGASIGLASYYLMQKKQRYVQI